ncbi:hypothetical protein J2S43_002375 [Catenuloplanes nepalensis]|uniref:MmyB-like transcription regulator ligand binding domain-containing protein n=1 Tax=Catenuloplanes nepalensis TaxID=587533 RepID=A0ABT9MRG6_9ACTN|nr:hypothetical protein [Catenuloplanes nepalensis]
MPDDAELTALVGELSIRSPEFARIWAGHPVHETPCDPGLRSALLGFSRIQFA